MKSSTRKVLLTGSEGFIGKNLVAKLKDQNADVVNIDKKNGIDISSWEQIKELEKVDLVIHLAAIVFVPFSFKNPRLLYKVNVEGTWNLLEYCRMREIDKFIFASSYVYGPPQYLPIDEDHPMAPNNPYTRSKLIGEELCRGYHQDYGLNCTILRPFNIYGPGQDENFLIPSIIKQLHDGHTIQLKDPRPRRDFLFVSDVVDIYMKASESNLKGFEIINVGSGVSYSVKEIVDKLIDISKSQPMVEYSGESRKNEVLETRADISKAKKLFDWEPQVDIDEGLRITYK